MFEIKVECPYCGNNVQLFAEFDGQTEPQVVLDDPEEGGCGNYFVMFVEEIHFKLLCSRIEGQG